jgi:hypothetical protein
VHADDAVGTLGLTGQLGDGDGGGVGGEDGFGGTQRVELREELLLDLEALAGGLNDKLAGGERLAFSTSRARFLVMVARPRSRKLCSTSTRTTLNPALAQT